MLEDEGLDRGDEDEVVENEVHGEDDDQNIKVSHFKDEHWIILHRIWLISNVDPSLN